MATPPSSPPPSSPSPSKLSARPFLMQGTILNLDWQTMSISIRDDHGAIKIVHISDRADLHNRWLALLVRKRCHASIKFLVHEEHEMLYVHPDTMEDVDGNVSSVLREEEQVACGLGGKDAVQYVDGQGLKEGGGGLSFLASEDFGKLSAWWNGMQRVHRLDAQISQHLDIDLMPQRAPLREIAANGRAITETDLTKGKEVSSTPHSQNSPEQDLQHPSINLTPSATKPQTKDSSTQADIPIQQIPANPFRQQQVPTSPPPIAIPTTVSFESFRTPSLSCPSSPCKTQDQRSSLPESQQEWLSMQTARDRLNKDHWAGWDAGLGKKRTWGRKMMQRLRHRKSAPNGFDRLWTD